MMITSEPRQTSVVTSTDSTAAANRLRQNEAEAFAKESNQIPAMMAGMLVNADVLLQHNEKALALSIIVKGINQFGSRPELLKRLAVCCATAAEKEQVLTALIDQENDFDTLVLFGNFLYEQNRDAEALETYQEALSAMIFESSSLFEIYKNMGNILARQSDFDGAQEMYHKAHSIKSNSDHLLVNLATLDIHKNEWNEALDKYRLALALNSKNENAWVGLSLSHRALGDFELACANAANAIEINPGNRTAVHLFCQLSAQLLKYRPAITAIQNYLYEVQSDEEMSLLLIHFCCQEGLLDCARMELERGLLWNPKSELLLSVEAEMNATR